MLALAFLTLFPHALTVSQVTCPCCHLLSASFLWLSFKSNSLFIHAGILLPLFVCFSVRVLSFLSLGRWFLTFQQLSWTLLLFRTTHYEILPGCSQNTLKSALLKFRAVILWMRIFLPPRILDSSMSWSYNQDCPALTSPTISSLFIRIKFSSVPLAFRSSGTCLWKVPSMHFRSLLDCLWLAGLSLQQISEWRPGPVEVTLLAVVWRSPPLCFPDLAGSRLLAQPLPCWSAH